MVAACFPRAMFNCNACAEADTQGYDQRGQNSGAPGACEGPRPYSFFEGELEWLGCPRATLTPRAQRWLEVFDRTGGKLSLTEYQRAPMLLLEVFRVLDYATVLKARDTDRQARQSFETRSRGER